MFDLARSAILIAGLTTIGVLFGGCSGSDADVTGPDDIGENAPVFHSTPELTADHNREYEYQLEVVDADGDEVELSAAILPDWMTFDPEEAMLSGTAGWENIARFPVSLQASDGNDSATQSFSVTVQRGEIVCDQEFGDPAGSEFALPYSVGKTYELIQSYCPSNPNWGHRNWFAYDFDTAIGDTVLASRGGEVILVQEHNPDVPDCSGNKENFVFILHDDGTVMHYMHLTKDGALVEKGDRLQRGQPIGLSGNSGCSAGPHLHVALFRNRTNFDRQSTVPFNYRNASGPHDSNYGLQTGASYEAL